jgi:Zn-dependent metalloprotease
MRIHNIYNPSTLGKLSLAIACALSFSATAAPAASVVAKVDASSLVTLQSNDINEMLALSGSESAKAVNSVNIATTGTIVTKFQQQLHGIDVFGRTFTAHQSAMGVFSDVKGKMVKGLKWQKKLSTSLITPEQALEIAVGSDRQGVDIADITNIQSQALIYPLAGISGILF